MVMNNQKHQEFPKQYIKTFFFFLVSHSSLLKNKQNNDGDEKAL